MQHPGCFVLGYSDLIMGTRQLFIWVGALLCYYIIWLGL